MAKRIAVALLIAWIAVSAWLAWTARPGLGDLGAFLASGNAARQGANPYAVAGLDLGGVAWPNLNPPISLPPFALASTLDWSVAKDAWFAVCLLLYVGLIVALIRASPLGDRPLRFLWLLALYPFWSCLMFGQIYVFIACLTGGAWLSLERRRWVLAGMLLGCAIAIKPQLGLWLVALLVARYVAPVLVAGGVAVILSAIPAVLYGPAVYQQWLAASLATQTLNEQTLGSVWSIAALLGHRELGAVFAVPLVLVVLGWAWTRPDVGHLSAVSLTVALLVAPVVWAGYLLFLLPAFVRWEWNLGTRLAAVATLLPSPVPLALIALLASHIPWHRLSPQRRYSRAVAST